jgi:hypothetical protein
VRYADITYVINRIRSIQIESDLSIEDEYQIDQLENLVYFPIRYYSISPRSKKELPAGKNSPLPSIAKNKQKKERTGHLIEQMGIDPLGGAKKKEENNPNGDRGTIRKSEHKRAHPTSTSEGRSTSSQPPASPHFSDVPKIP